MAFHVLLASFTQAFAMYLVLGGEGGGAWGFWASFVLSPSEGADPRFLTCVFSAFISFSLRHAVFASALLR